MAPFSRLSTFQKLDSLFACLPLWYLEQSSQKHWLFCQCWVGLGIGFFVCLFVGEGGLVEGFGWGFFVGFPCLFFPYDFPLGVGSLQKS